MLLVFFLVRLIASFSFIKVCKIIQIPFYKRLFSYFYPIELRRSAGDINEHLELLLYHNRLQLATADALYSDGASYTPALAAVQAFKGFLPSVNTVLVLGTGLGSIMQVINGKGYAPHYTLVEMDKTVLGWALELMEPGQARLATPVCADARSFMEQNRQQFDLVFVDIFMGMVVPDFVTSVHFLQLCKSSIASGGRLAMNYITQRPLEWEAVQATFGRVFPGYTVVDKGVNKILLTAYNDPETTNT